MLQKFNITTYAVVLCLFGFMLFTAAPVFADPQGEFDDCKALNWKDGKQDKKNCFRDLAEELLEINENLRTGTEELLEINENLRTRNEIYDDDENQSPVYGIDECPNGWIGMGMATHCPD